MSQYDGVIRLREECSFEPLELSSYRFYTWPTKDMLVRDLGYIAVNIWRLVERRLDAIKAFTKIAQGSLQISGVELR